MAGEEKNKNVRVIVACFPKSGSTFLFALLANLPGMRRQKLVPGFKRREQEICLERLREANLKTRFLRELWKDDPTIDSARPIGFVSQMHLRYSLPTGKIMKNFRITPIVLVRDIFDVVVSIRDHFQNKATYMSMAYVTEEMKEWDESKMQHFIADMVVPWYLNFYMCWQECDNAKVITYEKLVNDVTGTTLDVANYAGIPCSAQDIAQAIENAGRQDTRKNKAVAGRGQEVPDSVKEKIRHLAAYYPDVDFSPIGL